MIKQIKIASSLLCVFITFQEFVEVSMFQQMIFVLKDSETVSCVTHAFNDFELYFESEINVRLCFAFRFHLIPFGII